MSGGVLAQFVLRWRTDSLSGPLSIRIMAMSELNLEDTAPLAAQTAEDAGATYYTAALGDVLGGTDWIGTVFLMKYVDA